MTLDQKALEAAIRADQWPANLHAIVDAVNAASDDNDLSTEQCVALGIILASRSSAIIEEPMAVAWDCEFFRPDPSPRWHRELWKVDPRDTFGPTLVRNVRPLYAQPHTGRAGAAITEAMTDAFMEELNRQGVAMDDFSPPIYPARLIRAALNAALTGEPEAGEVTVKPLEWSEPSAPNDYCSYNHAFADTLFGRYQAEWKGWKEHPSLSLIFRGEDYIPCGDTLDAAKAAAQADYTARIRSALAP